MAQPQMARTTCNRCNASYNSERELGDHMRTAHRVFISEQSSKDSGTQQDNSKIQPHEQEETPEGGSGHGG